MSDLIAVAYPDEETAQTVRRTLLELTNQHVITLADAVIVVRDEKGKVKLRQAVNPAAAGAAGGALWGGVIGLLFLAPLLGMALGAATAGAAGAMTDFGVDDGFTRELGASLEPGGAALIVLVVSSTPDKVLPRIEQYGGTVVQTSLDAEAEARLAQALAGSTEPQPAAAG